MSEHREEHLELCAAYAVGNIDLADRHRLSEHLALGCAACHSALGDYGAATLLLAASAQAEPPSDRLRLRVLAVAGIGVVEEAPAGAPPALEAAGERRSSDASTPPRRSVTVPDDEPAFAAAAPQARAARPPDAAPVRSQQPAAFSRAGAAARLRQRAGARAKGSGSTPALARVRRPSVSIALPAGLPPPMVLAAGGLGLLSLILLIVTLNLAGALGTAKKDAATNLDALAQVNVRLQETQRWSDVMTSPTGRTATLVPTDGSVDGRGRATFDPTTRHAVIVFSGLQVPRGHVLELWSVAANGPSSLGMIQTDTFGRAIVHIEDAGDPNDLNGFAVSLESPGDTRRRRDPSRVVMLGRIEG